MDIEIAGKKYAVERTLSRNRNAWARLRRGTIRISIPARWPAHERERTGEDLLRRAIRSIETGRWKDDANTKVGFRNGQRISAMGRDFGVEFLPSGRFGCRLDGGRISVRVVETHPDKEKKASALIRRKIVEAVMDDLLARVHSLNRQHFNSEIRGVRIRDNTSRWGSCSRDGSISLNFRLLLMPQEILDYVIIHELAHTRYRSHGPRFWALVEKAVPDHMERRRWLGENGWRYPDSGFQPPVSGPETQGQTQNSKPETENPPVQDRKPDAGNGNPPPGQQKLEDFYEEPY
ncbi:MAG: SprT family zinc-dependent metalloprotease [Candidatus Micrarchaeota archaeon]